MSHPLVVWECEHITETWTWQDNRYDDWSFAHTTYNEDHDIDDEICEPTKYEIPLDDIRNNLDLEDYKIS